MKSFLVLNLLLQMLLVLKGTSASRRQAEGGIDGEQLSLFRRQRTYNEAKAFCERRDEMLAEIRSVATYQAVISKAQQIGRSLWIGASDQDVEGEWVWESQNDSASFLQTRWQKCSPNENPGNLKDCAVVRPGGIFKDIKCTARRSFVCQPPVQLDSGSCSVGFLVEGQCYLSFPILRNYDKAQFICDLHNGTLAELRSEVIRNFLTTKAAEQSTPLWIGANDRETEGTFVWPSTNETVNYPHEWWESGQPDNANNSEDCLTLGQSGTIRDVSCDSEAFYFCERSIDVPPKPCGVVIDGGCYRKFASTRNYDAAYVICGVNDRIIAEPRSKRIVNALTGLMESSEEVWIGATDRAVEGTFVWNSTSEEVNFPPRWWAMGEPSDPDGSVDCLVLRSDGKIINRTCDLQLSFFCRE